jgi:hypothetical protein
MNDWPFADPKNVAVFTTRSVVVDRKPILTVYHNEDDGAWQFHHDKEPKTQDAMIILLSEIVEIDDSVKQLADLPFGWLAWRSAKDKPWQRKQDDLSAA